MDSCRDDSQTWTPAGSKSLSLSLSSTRTLSLSFSLSLSSTHAHNTAYRKKFLKKVLLNSFLVAWREREREEGETGKEMSVCMCVCVWVYMSVLWKSIKNVTARECDRVWERDCDKEQWRRMQNKASICFYNSELEQILMFRNFFADDDESGDVSSETNWPICFSFLSFSWK